MRLGILTSSVSRDAGGLHDATRCLAQALHRPPEVDVQVLTLRDRFTAADLNTWDPVPVNALPTSGPGALGYAPKLSSALTDASLDILHVHGLWMYPSLASLAWAQRRQTGGLVISPHGMLDRWALKSGHWKKRLVGQLYENAHLRRADCLHALTEAELQSIRAYGLVNPVCVIPNAIDLPSAAPHVPDWRRFLPEDAKVLLYLGRLHAKKGLEPFLETWARVSRLRTEATRQWHLVIAGWNQGGCEAELRTRAAQLNLDRVHFAGPQFGADKSATYGAADAFVLPSFSEGLPMVVLEAWSYGLPVLMTAACNLSEGFVAEAAIEITTEPDGSAAGLEALINASNDARRAMGERGRTLVRRNYSWERVSAEMRAVYTWLVGGGAQPACVV